MVRRRPRAQESRSVRGHEPPVRVCARTGAASRGGVVAGDGEGVAPPESGDAVAGDGVAVEPGRAWPT